MPGSDKRFARQHCDQPPPRFPAASLSLGIVHHLSGPDVRTRTRIPVRTPTRLGKGRHNAARWSGGAGKPVALAPRHTRPRPSAPRDGWGGAPTGAHPPARPRSPAHLQRIHAGGGGASHSPSPRVPTNRVPTRRPLPGAGKPFFGGPPRQAPRNDRLKENSSPLAHTTGSLVRVTRRVVGGPTRQAPGRPPGGSPDNAWHFRFLPPNRLGRGETPGTGGSTAPSPTFSERPRHRTSRSRGPPRRLWHLSHRKPAQGRAPSGGRGPGSAGRVRHSRFQGRLLVRIRMHITAGHIRPDRARCETPRLGTRERGPTAHRRCLRRLRALLILHAESFSPFGRPTSGLSVSHRDVAL